MQFDVDAATQRVVKALVTAATQDPALQKLCSQIAPDTTSAQSLLESCLMRGGEAHSVGRLLHALETVRGSIGGSPTLQVWARALWQSGHLLRTGKVPLSWETSHSQFYDGIRRLHADAVLTPELVDAFHSG
jgi:hypothetical protein